MNDNRCPNCNSYSIIEVGIKINNRGEKRSVYVCKACYKVFYVEIEGKDETSIYNPKFKYLYITKKIPEIAEHEKFKGQEKISENDKTDLKIDFWLMENRRKNENTRTDNK